MRGDFFFSLRFRLVALVLVAVLPVLGLSIYEGVQQRRHALLDAQTRTLTLAKSASAMQDIIVDEARTLLATLAELPQVQQRDPQACGVILANILEKSKRYLTSHVIYPDGVPFASAPPITSRVSYADRDWYRRVLQTRDFVVSEYLLGKLSAKPILAFAHPVFNRTGDLVAIAVITLDLEWFNRFIATRDLPKGATLTVVDRNGVVLARHPDPQEFVGRAKTEAPLVQAVLLQGEGVIEAPGLDGVPRVYGFTYLGPPSTGVHIAVGLPEAAVFAAARRDFIIHLGGLGLVALVALAAAWVGGERFIRRQVNDLLGVSRQLGAGDLAVRAGPPYRQGELGQLARAFDDMAGALQRWEAARREAMEELRQAHLGLEAKVAERTAELQGANVRLTREIAERQQAEAALERSTQELAFRNRIATIFLTASDDYAVAETVLQVILEASASRYGVYGYLDEDGALVVPSMTRHIWEQCQVPDKDFVFPRETWGNSIWPRALREKRTLYDNTPSTLTPPGHIQIERNVCVPIIYGGDVIGLVHVANKETDYTEADIRLMETLGQNIAPILNARLQRDRQEKGRRRAEAALAHKAQELAWSNAELEQFAYVASHDLQEPLRVIVNYLQLLERRYQGNIDAEAEKFIARAVAGAGRMKQLITDLLLYSRVGTKGKPLDPTDCEAACREALDNLRAAVEEAGAVVHLQALPTVQADAGQMTQLFQNLIGNAVKFHGPEPPEVEVAAEPQGEEWRFAVRDNGIGMEPEYLERIFGVFQRLHTRTEYPGTGIGLAVCQKIVERHRGRIWAESALGQGSTFYFTIPRQGGSQA